MLIQVHTQEKPAIRRRTIAAAIALLAISTGLAASLTQHPSGTQTEPVITLPGWSVAVRPPAETVARAVHLDSGEGLLLQFPTSRGIPRQMLVLRIERTDESDLLTLATRALLSLRQPHPHVVGNLPIVWRNKTLGGHDAVEIWDPGAGVALRAGRVHSGEVYAVVFSPGGNTQNAYAIFDGFCHSIEDHPN